ncbi:hypothetical protein PybrP1_007341 [[Pythium] brassicae (nom. inval.)]|nr:hypothetical protein PybrP1_007341 [[Pythium] brassicae (nom. inval.)]
MAPAPRRPAASADDAAGAKRQRVDAAGGGARAEVNAYAGFRVPHDGFQLERVRVGDVTPESFFARFVATRTPVVLEGVIPDAAFTAPDKWSNAYLAETAGDARLAVERRAGTHEKFGRGIEVPMRFRELLALIAGGDELHYLTTQDVEADEHDGRPELMAPFVARLQHDFPLQPALLGHLVPQNINIWMGNNRDGSSSGLHHDYHDNLYILLRGKKRFRLYSPADAQCMYTRGTLLRVHANGRINYEGEETTADGADPLAEAAALAAAEKDDAERELALAEHALASAGGDDPAAQARLAAAESRLDRAMLALLRVEREDDANESEPEDGEFGAFHFDEDEDSDDSEREGEGEQDDESAGARSDADDADDAETPERSDGKRLVDKTVKDPVNFSRIDTFMLRDAASKEALLREFPRFADATAAFCELGVGDMLYLPASWFHEVESFGGGAANGGHLALNYWYHPPDACESFETPYASPFWPRDWAQRLKQRAEQRAAEDDAT